MRLTHKKLRQIFSDFWKSKNHKEITPISLIPENDSTTLFTGFGMQQLVPFLLGEKHPLGKLLYNIQPCFRCEDIEEVGDNRHTVFFEMMGNWSLGDYFKQEQISMLFELLIEKIGLNPNKLYVSVFAGEGNIPKDNETIEILKQVFKKYEIDAEINKRIFLYGSSENWWSRSGTPNDMPSGEPGGPDSEIFYDFGKEHKMHENSKYKDNKCHINCQCGRFLEIGNSVFMQYIKNKDKSFSQLPKKNIDFGGGLERILMAVNNTPDIFKLDVFEPLIKSMKKVSNKEYKGKNMQSMRVIADHIKSTVFMAKEGLIPSNKEQGYFMRRLIRKAVVKMRQLDIEPVKVIPVVCKDIVNIYKDIYFNEGDGYKLHPDIEEEANNFSIIINKTSDKLLKIQGQENKGKFLFNLKQTYGFPYEIAIDSLQEMKIIDEEEEEKIKEEYIQEFKKHQKESRTSSSGMFKGGLANQNKQTIKYHTASHLIHQALFDVLGEDVKQKGSNITGERLRFDFHCLTKIGEEEIKKVKDIVNNNIKKNLKVTFKELSKEKALKIGAKAFFKQRYPDKVKVYSIDKFSKEICSGPHVKSTKEIGEIKIYKIKKIGKDTYRIYGKNKSN